MVKIEIAGLPFNVPQKWGEVPFDKALKLYNREGFNITDIVTDLIDAPSKKVVKYNSGVVLTVFELLAFVMETPQVVTDFVEVPEIRSKWTYRQYELIRQAIGKHKDYPALSFARITEILEQPKEHYVEVGAKAFDMIIRYVQGWGDYLEGDKPTEKEIEAGIERLQVFGTYSILEGYAKKYGKFPREAELENAHAVITDWIKGQELIKYTNNYQELNKPQKV